MKKYNLTGQTREIIGKKAAKLRSTGVLPAAIYGKDIESLNIQLPLKDFSRTYSDAGETGLIDLLVGKQTFTVLIKNVQRHPVSSDFLHAEFHKVNLKEKIKANIPVELVGESPAVGDGLGLILQPLGEVEVEALPTDLPEKIEVSVEKLVSIDDQITVGDLIKPKDVEILTSAEEVVVKVVPAVSEEAKKEAEEEAAAAQAAKAETGEAATTEQAPEPATTSSEEKPKE